MWIKHAVRAVLMAPENETPAGGGAEPSEAEKKAADEKARKDAEAKSRAEERAKKEAEAKAQREAAEKARADEREKREAERARAQDGGPAAKRKRAADAAKKAAELRAAADKAEAAAKQAEQEATAAEADAQGLVFCIVPKAFKMYVQKLIPNDAEGRSHQMLETIKAGNQALPREIAESRYAKQNGVQIVGLPVEKA